MELFTLPNDPDSIRAKLVVREKEIPCQMIEVNLDNPDPDIDLDVTQFSGKLTLRDKRIGNLLFNDSDILMEYFEERFPYPPLMPAEPMERAQCRILVRLFRDRWFPLYQRLENGEREARNLFNKELQLFSQWISGSSWIFGKDITIADCSVFPFFLRHKFWKIPVAPRSILDKYFNRFLTHDTILIHFSHEIDLFKNTTVRARRSTRN